MTPELKGFLLVSVLKMLFVFTVVMVGVALLTLLERKVSAWIQNRLGPNRVGYRGLLQPAADGLKNFIKEETLPAQANKVLFTLAPALSFVPALLLAGVIPFAAPLPGFTDFAEDVLGKLPLLGGVLGRVWNATIGPASHPDPIPMVVADLPVGFLFILAISSLGVYGIALAGWASNSKYSLLGGLRASAQMVSYEVPLAMSLVPVLLLSGDVRLTAIVAEQAATLWFVLPLFFSFFLFLVAGFAETNRLPFDMPEAEAELIAGYHTEYSAMKFSMFFIAEYAHIVTVAALVATIFFGGWDIPFTAWDQTPGLLQTAVTAGVMFVKVMFFIFVVMWVRWTLPRFRFDQLMALGWKFMLPVALAYVMLIGASVWMIEDLAGIADPRVRGLLLFGVNLLLAGLVFFGLDRGFIVQGAGARAAARRRAAGALARAEEGR